jgi:hypothetical protein
MSNSRLMAAIAAGVVGLDAGTKALAVHFFGRGVSISASSAAS